jgi:hypothetical protein
MTSEHSLAVAKKARAIYEQRLRAQLESQQADKFVAIEPDSGDFFLGASYSESVMAAAAAHPGRICFVIRVGHEAALHLGGLSN